MIVNADGSYCDGGAERFWAKVNKTESCWIWTAKLTKSGYGQITVAGRRVQAHRFAWTLLRGPIPEGMYVCHDCPGGDNPACVNPDHLFLGTHADNMRDAAKKGRHFLQRHPERSTIGDRLRAKTHCVRGHPLTPENIYPYPNKRVCRLCVQERIQAMRKPNPEREARRSREAQMPLIRWRAAAKEGPPAGESIQLLAPTRERARAAAASALGLRIRDVRVTRDDLDDGRRYPRKRYQLALDTATAAERDLEALRCPHCGTSMEGGLDACYFTQAQAARIMGVTNVRVAKLVAEGRLLLTPPTRDYYGTYGSKVHALDIADIADELGRSLDWTKARLAWRDTIGRNYGQR